MASHASRSSLPLVWRCLIVLEEEVVCLDFGFAVRDGGTSLQMSLSLLFTELVFCSPRSAFWVQVPWDIGADPAEGFEDLSCTVSSGFQWGGQFCPWTGFRAVSVRKAFLLCLCLDIWPSDKLNCCASGQRADEQGHTAYPQLLLHGKSFCLMQCSGYTGLYISTLVKSILDCSKTGIASFRKPPG